MVFKEAIEKAELSKMNDIEIARYNASLKAYRDNINTFNYALKEGLKKATDEGELKRAIEMASKCLKRGIPLADVAYLTGLTENEIRNIVL